MGTVLLFAQATSRDVFGSRGKGCVGGGSMPGGQQKGLS
jgi:hypothetical protein